MEEALSTLCGDVCLCIGPEILSLSVPISVSPAPPQPSDTATWLCKDALFFTLFRQGGSTLLFSHSNGVLYHASPQAQLSPACPAVGFLCQFTRDTLPEGLVPRLLVFDVIPGRAMDALERGELLRSLAVHLPQPLCTVQWVGPSRYLTPEFMGQLPHTISGLMRLGPDPLRPGIYE